ncbi:MAG: hypothetical protein WCV72_04485 [Patescibacteria group bacterium]|jgi:hypothetical protein
MNDQDNAEVSEKKSALPAEVDSKLRDKLGELAAPEAEKTGLEKAIKEIESLVGNSAALAQVQAALNKAIAETEKINRTAGLSELIEKLKEWELECDDFKRMVNGMLQAGQIKLDDVPEEIESQENGKDRLLWIVHNKEENQIRSVQKLRNRREKYI